VSAVDDVLSLPEDQQVFYDLSGWDFDRRAGVIAALAERAIPHAWDDDELVVGADHEDAVDALFDELDTTGEITEVEDVDDVPDELMSELYLTADRLARHPGDPDAAATMLVLLGDTKEEWPPYGLDGSVWKRVVDDAHRLGDTLSGEDDDVVAAAAEDLRARLRELV
jgi:hypothetical protein